MYDLGFAHTAVTDVGQLLCDYFVLSPTRGDAVEGRQSSAIDHGAFPHDLLTEKSIGYLIGLELQDKEWPKATPDECEQHESGKAAVESP